MDSDATEDQASLTVRFLEDQAQKLAAPDSGRLKVEITGLKARNGSALADWHADDDRYRQLQRADRPARK